MKVNELRIGNYINEYNKPITIDSVHFRDYYEGITNEEDWSPIPLTEEWLLKFGFSDITELCAVKTQNTKRFCKSYFVDKCTEQQTLFITLGSRGWTFKGVGAPLYNSVHQLQNLYFALTGEELA